MKELEKLLNNLVEKGWKPWGREINKAMVSHKNDIGKDKNLFIGVNFSDGFGAYYSWRDLVSLDSGLWQFVCKNKLHKKTESFWENVSKTSTNIWWFNHNYQYRLLESALIPEEELGRFLIENIKI